MTQVGKIEKGDSSKQNGQDNPVADPNPPLSHIAPPNTGQDGNVPPSNVNNSPQPPILMYPPGLMPPQPIYVPGYQSNTAAKIPNEMKCTKAPQEGGYDFSNSTTYKAQPAVVYSYAPAVHPPLYQGGFTHVVHNPGMPTGKHPDKGVPDGWTQSTEVPNQGPTVVYMQGTRPAPPGHTFPQGMNPQVLQVHTRQGQDFTVVGTDATSNAVIETVSWTMMILYAFAGLILGLLLSLVGLCIGFCLLKTCTEKRKRIPFFVGISIGIFLNVAAVSFRMYILNDGA